jgi:hypothetical protein
MGIERKILESDDLKVVLFRVPKSWNAPHMARISGVTRFYSRRNEGKYLMDVGELRLAFNLASSLPDRLERLRLERLGRITAGDAPWRLDEGPKMVLHILPLGALDSIGAVDLGSAPNDLQLKLGPMRAGAWSHRLNFDGFLTYDSLGQNYVQLYRSGMIESVSSIGSKVAPPERKDSLPSLAIERDLISGAEQYLRALRDLGVQPPVFVLLSLLGVKGKYLARNNWFYGPTPVIDRDILPLPSVLMEDFDVSLPQALKPAIDLLWQASGYSNSPNFDADGNWQPVQ